MGKLPRAPELAWIDGLRAIAVGLVIAYHSNLVFADGTPVVGGGFVGVDIFFVISGYLVTKSIIDKHRSGPHFMRTFWIARIRRVVPALLLVVLCSLAAAYAWMWPKELGNLAASAVSAVTFVSNVFFYLQDPYEAANNATTPLIHTWSLSVEAQFYLLYPLLLLGALGRPTVLVRRLALLTAMSWVIAVAATWIDNSATFYFAPSRFWEFGLGATVFAARQRGQEEVPGRLTAVLPVVGLVLIGYAGWAFADTSYRLPIHGLLPVVGTALLLGWTDGASRLASVLQWRPIAFVGLISYSLYLWHQPVLAFSRIRRATDLAPVDILMAITLTLVLSILSWRFVEEPFRRRRRLRMDRHAYAGLGAAVGALAAVGLVAATFPVTRPGSSTSPLVYQPERGIAVVDGKACQTNKVDGACVLGDRSVAPSFALLGDSHALTMSAPISDMLRRHRRSGLLLTQNGCPFIEGVRRSDIDYWICDVHVEKVFHRIAADHITSVIIDDYRNLYLTGIGGDGKPSTAAVHAVDQGAESSTRQADVSRLERATIRRLLAAGVTVYFVTTVPDGPSTVPTAVRNAIKAGTLPYTTDLDAYLKRSRPLFADLTTFDDDPKFTVIYAHRSFCSETTRRCATHSDRRLYYADSNHLSSDGGRVLARAIEARIRW